MNMPKIYGCKIGDAAQIPCRDLLTQYGILLLHHLICVVLCRADDGIGIIGQGGVARLLALGNLGIELPAGRGGLFFCRAQCLVDFVALFQIGHIILQVIAQKRPKAQGRLGGPVALLVPGLQVGTQHATKA